MEIPRSLVDIEAGVSETYVFDEGVDRLGWNSRSIG